MCGLLDFRAPRRAMLLPHLAGWKFAPRGFINKCEVLCKVLNKELHASLRVATVGVSVLGVQRSFPKSCGNYQSS